MKLSEFVGDYFSLEMGISDFVLRICQFSNIAREQFEKGSGTFPQNYAEQISLFSKAYTPCSITYRIYLKI